MGAFPVSIGILSDDRIFHHGFIVNVDVNVDEEIAH